jgi:TonB-linked SusC/RagA family outer membrane protein
MRNIKFLMMLFLVFIAGKVSAQNIIVEGKVLDSGNKPIAGAVVTVSGMDGLVQSDENGAFEIETNNANATINVSADGFYDVFQPIKRRKQVKILMISKVKTGYNEQLVLPYNKGVNDISSGKAVNINEKDFGSSISVEEVLKGKVAGLNVTDKSGMPGEGAYLNLRGVKSFITNNSPLIVINGIPFLADDEDSPVIGGYSGSVFSSLDVNDIENITVLKGADASLYGSLGSNGVILIRTKGPSSEDLDTKITLSSMYGVNWNNRRLPLLGVEEYKSYLSDVGMTYYENMEDLFNDFPFLKDNPDYYYNYLYNNNTDWQDEIYSPSVVTDNVLRVEGGDAVAKYDISLGYMKNGGIIDKTKQERYQTQIGANILINRKLELFTNVGLSYLQGDFQEQGMLEATNPVLAAYRKQPVLSPYKKDDDGKILDEYDQYRYDISNPLAIVNTLSAESKQYNVNLNMRLNYSLNEHLSFSGIVGLYYNYRQQDVFIPGVTEKAIIPMNYDLAENTVRSGVGETRNYFYSIQGAYQKTFNDIHDVNISVGSQLLTTKREFDAGSGYNTASDFYQTLAYVESGSEMFYGYIYDWNWANYNFHGDYIWNHLVKSSVNLAVDGSSASGIDADRYSIFPSGEITLMAKNLKPLMNSVFLNRLNIRAGYGLTGNSYFSSKYGKNYYHSSAFLSLSGIVRSNIPNTDLEWEKTRQLEVGLDMSLLSHRFNLSADYFNAVSSDVVINQPLSSVYGNSEFFENAAEISNRGIEISLDATILKFRNFDWTIGGTLGTIESEVKDLGKENENIIELEDGGEMITRIGENPYNFYGYKALGVFSSEAEAGSAALSNWQGASYGGGDVHYDDVNGDHIINDDDKQILGSALPDMFGSFFSSFRYKNFTLSASFNYSWGNEAYNAVRRVTESMDDFANQSGAVVNRWRYDGQVTDIPRAVYDDPIGNNSFSSRWIEDASYIKLSNVSLKYNFNKTVLGFFRSGTIYVTGENLYTWTDYLGLDPEFSYSYSDIHQGVDYCKVVPPKSVKFGFSLKF